MAQPEASGGISGTVFDRITCEPVRKAIVTVLWFGTPRSWGTTATDGDGHFSFEGLPPGKYQLHATKPGVGTGSYGSDVPEWLTLAGGEKKSIRIGLFRQGSIAGTVADMDGDPVTNAEVGLFREGYPRGTRELVPGSMTRTDDRGEFRFSNLIPGKYYVAASRQQRDRSRLRDNAPTEVFVRQFYGGATDWKRAIPVNLGSGEAIRGVDFHLTPVRAIRLRGRLAGMPETQSQPGEQRAGVTIQLTSAGNNRMSMGAVAGPPEYRFEFGDVAPGVYYLSAETTSESRHYYALQKLELTDDPGEITLALAPAVDLKGRVALEGETSDPIQSFRVNLTRGDGVGMGGISARTAPDGTYTLKQVPPGVWDIGVSPIPKGGYLKAMRLGKQDVLTEEMEISASTDAPLNIVVSSRGAVVEGQIQGTDENRSPALVALAPLGKLRNVISFYDFAQADIEGKFKIIGVTPGQYKIFAFASPPAGGIRNPDLILKLDSLGEAVEVSEGGRAEAHPKLITGDQIKEAQQ